MGDRERRILGIASRAIPLWQRDLRPNLERPPSGKRTAVARLARWQDVMGGDGALAQRLQKAGPLPSPPDFLVGSNAVEASLHRAPWTKALATILRESPQGRRTTSTGQASHDPARPLPFQEVLSPFARYARRRLNSEAGSALKVLSADAVEALERQLLAHLTFVASLTLGQVFYEFRFEKAPVSALEGLWNEREPSYEVYNAFVEHMGSGGLHALFDAYPVLARLLCQSVEQWVIASADLCRRFAGDFASLRTTFEWEVQRPEAAVRQLRTDLSDRHRGGQTVTECILGAGERVVYKPRSLNPEIAYNQFIGWLNGCGLSLELRTLTVVDRHTYGWVESVAPDSCSSDDAVDRFYRRAGMLLCTLHVLAATDIHCENVIASGEHPVVVDLETLLSGDGYLTSDSTEKPSRPSVAGTGMLPRWQIAPDGRRFDMSALGADGKQDAGIDRIAWLSVNSDQMRLSNKVQFSASLAHRVRIGASLPTLREHLGEFLSGFEEVYRHLLKNRDALLEDAQVMATFDGLELRTLLRSTATYTRLLLRLMHPEFMKDGLDRSIELEWLARPLSGPVTDQQARIQIYECERDAMEGLDVPYFGTSSWRGLKHSEHDPDLVLLCGVRDSRIMRGRLIQMSRSDLGRQIQAIKGAVEARFGSG